MNIRKNSLIKITAISFLLTIFWSGAAYAQPNITGFSGSLTHKGALTITGSGFGTKATAAPFKWDDFESGTLGANLGNGWWSTAVGGGGPLPKYDNTVLRTGSAKSVLQDYTYPGVGSTGGNRQYGAAFGLVNQNNNKYYISFWRYLTTAGSPVRNFKTLALRGGTPGQWENPEARMDTYAIYGPTYGYFYTVGCDGTPEVSRDGQFFSHATGVWMRLEFYIDTGTIGGTDGIYWHARDGVERVRLSNQVMRTSSCAFSNLYINGYFSRELNDNDASAYIWNDDVYIDTTQARVEISDSPTWNSATTSHREIQIPSAWSDASITITLNKGSFTNFNNAYLYVIDADGNVNTNGYLLSDGGGGGGGTGGNTPPLSSSSDSSSSGGSGCGLVKDINGKGKGAKGEGLAFAMMLIITLIGIALVKRIRFLNKILFFTIAILLFHFSIANAWIVNATWEKFAVGSTGGDQNIGQGDGLYNGNSRLSVVDTYAHSGKNSLRIFLPKGGPDWQHEFRLPSSITEGGEFWGRFYIYPPTGFDWTATPITKIFRTVVVDSANNGKGFISILAIKPDYYQCSAKSATPSVYGWIVGGAEMLSSEGFVCQNQASADDFLTPGQWHALELYIKVSSNGVGIFRIWHQGKLIWEKTGISNIPPAGKLWHGDGISANHFLGYWNGGVPQDQYLYIDDFTYTNQTPAQKDAVGNSMIGLIDWQSGGDSGGSTPPPSSSSGGDSGGGSGGGSGCGFVKEINGKGPKAKGKGLAFAVMLIITLAGIALIRRIIVGLKMRRTFSALNKGLRFFVVAVLLAQIAACGSGGVSDSSNSSNSSSGGSGGGTNNGAATINMVLPQNNSVGAALDTYITLQSSAPLNPATVSASTFYIRGTGNSAITATVSYQNQAVTIRPQSSLQPLTTYTVTCANGVLDSNGVSLPTSTWSFTTTNAAGNPIPLQGQWESDMVTYGNQWGLFLQNPNNSLDAKLNNVYYDGERTFYQIASYLGQQEPWNSYAQAAETTFRDNYFIPNNYNIPGYYRFPDGLYLDAQRNGDTTSAAGLLLMRDNPAFSNPENNVYAGNWYWSQFSREIAYAIGTNILAERAGNARQTQRMQLYLAMALNHLHEWRTQTFGNPDATYHYFQPFMFGLTADALISYYEWEIEQGRTPDETIPNAIKAMADWMWTAPVVDQSGKNMWVPNLGGTAGAWTDTGGTGYGAFRYSDRTYTVSGGGQPNPAPDLNLLIAPSYAWLYKHFGDPAYRDRGDLLWAGGVALASLGYSGKIYNQNYRLSFNCVKWRQEGLAKWGN